MKDGKATIVSVISLLFALWFLATGWLWTYFANLFIAYPAAIISFLLWRSLPKTASVSRLRQAVPIVLVCGIVVSLSALFLFK